jgi:predicted RNA-binding Zn ribbon-like protein
MNHGLPVKENHAFTSKDLVGGDVVLDFVNTMTGRNGQPRDWIADYDGLADWAAVAGILAKSDCERLKRRARQSPAAASAALMAARELRELLFSLLSQIIGGRDATEVELARLHTFWIRSVNQHQLKSVDGHIEPVLLGTSTAFDRISAVLTIRAVELLRHLPKGRVRMCCGPDCAWIFIDSSKAGRRRWCDMSTCGNDAKAKRFYRAKRAVARGPSRAGGR